MITVRMGAVRNDAEFKSYAKAVFSTTVPLNKRTAKFVADQMKRELRSGKHNNSALVAAEFERFDGGAKPPVTERQAKRSAERFWAANAVSYDTQYGNSWLLGTVGFKSKRDFMEQHFDMPTLKNNAFVDNV